jgi:uncharacterized protein YndB with AHSA1/START domain
VNAIHLQRTFAAPVERVFQALVEPAQLIRWWGPADVVTSEAEVDLRAGGQCRYVMHPHGQRAVLFGRIVELDPPRLIAMTHRWEGDTTETLVTIRLESAAGGTRLHLTQTGLSADADPDEFARWWTSVFDGLGRLLAKDTPMPTSQTAQLCRAYFETWTNRRGADALRPLLAENFVFQAGPVRVEGREEFLGFAAWPDGAVTEMVADAYEDDHGLQLYVATNGSASVKIVEHLVVTNGSIASTETITDGAAFAAFLAGGDG